VTDRRGAALAIAARCDMLAAVGWFGSRPTVLNVQRRRKTMKIRSALFATTLLFAGSAFAFHCPAEMKKIDEALAKNPKLTTAQMDEVKKYRADGEKLHKEGKHQESVDTLAKAEKILGIPTN
jgi:hypothetical protein